jgi:hypothetical protein
MTEPARSAGFPMQTPSASTPASPRRAAAASATALASAEVEGVPGISDFGPLTGRAPAGVEVRFGVPVPFSTRPALGSQPITIVEPACCMPVSRGRNEISVSPHSRTVAGPVAAGLRRWILPLSGTTSRPTARASRQSSCQSVSALCWTNSSVPPAASIVPARSPFAVITFLAMSATVICWKVWLRRIRWSLWLAS